MSIFSIFMNKPTTAQNVLLIISVTIVALVLVWFITKDTKTGDDNNSTDTSEALSLYYREDCPHCKNVEKFLLDNKVGEKIKIEHKEIMNDIKNNNELMVRAANCNLDLETVGVPLLYDKGTCYVGDQEIINYFQSRL
jgi:glutaredoxin